MGKQEIQDILHEQLPFLMEAYHVKRLGIFGSVVRGEETKESDVDILVEFKDSISFFAFIRLENYLSDLLQQKVDLISSKALKPAIKNDVLKEIIYA